MDHIIQASDHGFTYEKTGALFIMADGLSGNTEIEVSIEGIIFKKVSVAREIVFADAIVERGECLSLCNYDAIRYNWGV